MNGWGIDLEFHDWKVLTAFPDYERMMDVNDWLEEQFGREHWRSDEYDFDIIEPEHFQPEWFIEYFFKDEKKAILFKLFWSEYIVVAV